MEKIINTTKYMKALKFILIAVAFSIISPLVTLADTIEIIDGEEWIILDPVTQINWPVGIDTGSTYPTGIDTGSNYPTGIDTGSTYPTGIDTGSTYPTGIDTGSTYPTGIDTGSTYVRSYYTQPTSVLGGGGYSNTYVPTYYTQPSSVLGGGGFVSGYNSTYVPTYYTQPTSVLGGSFTGTSPVYTQPTTYTYTQPTVIPNQVLAYTDTNPSLDSVYLSDIPATGFEDILPMLIFISSLILWSGILAYVFLKRKVLSQTVLSRVATNTKVNDSKTSDFMNQIATDNSDICKVEEYARMNKVLLSSDAGAKIVKLSRLGKINASEYIRSIATGEWVAIGENQII